MTMPESRHQQPRRRQRGARHSETLLRHRLGNYLHHHRETSVSSLRRLGRSPVQTAMTVLVIAIAMALPAALYSAVENLRQLGGNVELNARMSVFLDKSAGDDEVATLVAEVEKRRDIASIVYLSRESALDEFREASGFGDVLALLPDNPLPAAILVRPAPEITQDPAAAQKLADWLKAQPNVDDVSVDLEWLRKLHAFVDVGQQMAIGLGVLLAIGVLLVMGNTIRLAIENRREEIVVVKLIGGTDGYVRRPFLYAGLWYGLGGGFLAWLLVWTGFLALSSEFRQIAALYQSEFALRGPGFTAFLTLAAGGGLLGLAGAWIAVAGHLREIEPE